MLSTTAPGISSDKGELRAHVYSPEDIPFAWDLLEPFFQQAVDISEGRVSLSQIKGRLLEGSLTAFATCRKDQLELVWTAEISHYPSTTVARVFSLSGKNFKEAYRFIDALEAWALVQGAVALEAYCQPVMARLLRRFGWMHKYAIVTRDLRRRMQ